MRTILIIAFIATLRAQPQLTFVQTATGVDLTLAGGASAAAIQTQFAVPAGAVVTPGSALGTTKTLASRVANGGANLIVYGGASPLPDGVIASISAPGGPFAYCPTAIAADAQGAFVPGVAAAPLAYVPPQSAALVMQRDFWKFGAPGYRLSYPVAGGEGNALVYLNGLLMLRGADYQLVGTLLQFSGQDVMAMQNPIVQVIYWH